MEKHTTSPIKLVFGFYEGRFRLSFRAPGGRPRFRIVRNLINFNLQHWSYEQQRFAEVTDDDKHNNRVLEETRNIYQSIIDTYHPTTLRELFWHIKSPKNSQSYMVYGHARHDSAHISECVPTLSLSDFDDKQLFAELKRRGFTGELRLSKTVAI